MIKRFDIFKRNTKKDYIVYSLIDGVLGIEKYIFVPDKIDKMSITFIDYNAQSIENLNTDDILLFTEKEATKIVDKYNKLFTTYRFYTQKYEDLIIELDVNKYNL